MLMHRSVAALAVFGAALGVAITPARAQQLQRPAGWTAILDGGVSDTIYYVRMPPGWHMTTGPGAFLFDPAFQASGRYTVESDIFLFPGASQSGYGLFVGGQQLESASPSYLAFLIRRDGQAALEYVARGERRALIPWGAAPAVKPHPGGDDTVLNKIALTVDRDSLIVEANGTRVGAVPRGDLALDGTFGFRLGPDVNLHVSRLDLHTRLAPIPPQKRPS